MCELVPRNVAQAGRAQCAHRMFALFVFLISPSARDTLVSTSPESAEVSFSTPVLGGTCVSLRTWSVLVHPIAASVNAKSNGWS